MKINPLLVALIFPLLSLAQVGIGTTNPTETLEVNGTMKINTTDQSSVTTTKLAGTDDNGVIRDINLGSNLSLNNNILSVNVAVGTGNSNYSFGEITLNSDVKEHHNVDLLIGNRPVIDVNREHKIIRISLSDIEEDDKDTNITITGFREGFDGQHIWIYAQDGEIELEPDKINTQLPLNPNGSQPNNIIEKNNKMKMDRYEMIELIYDGARNKWIIMYHH